MSTAFSGSLELSLISQLVCRATDKSRPSCLRKPFLSFFKKISLAFSRKIAYQINFEDRKSTVFP